MLGSLLDPNAQRQANPIQPMNPMASGPATQAALLNMAIQFMTPRWNPQSAIPDAMSAGARTMYGIQDQDYEDQVAQQTVATRAGERAEDRSTRLQAAEIAAGSRQNVAETNANSRLAVAQQRQLQGNDPWTKAYNIHLREYVKTQANSISSMRRSPEELGDEAAGYARRMATEITGLDGPATAPGGGARTRQNPASAPGPVGQGGPSGAPNGTRPNLPNERGQTDPGAVSATPKKTTRQYLQELNRKSPGSVNQILRDPAALAHFKTKVTDPQMADQLARALGGGK